jgi:TetR/AcrR family fatty acid metabolism transcriptional regulator
MTSRQAQAIRTKEKLFTTAMNLIDKKGFDNVTVQEISKKANVSVGIFYHYFESKNDILFEIYKLADNYFRDEVSQLLDKDNSLERILQFFYYYAKYNHDRGLESIKLLYNPKNKGFILKERYMLTLLQNIIRIGQEKCEIVQDMTPEQICNDLFIISRGVVYDWCLHEGNYDLPEVLTVLLKRVILSFAAIPIK